METSTPWRRWRSDEVKLKGMAQFSSAVECTLFSWNHCTRCKSETTHRAVKRPEFFSWYAQKASVSSIVISVSSIYQHSLHYQQKWERSTARRKQIIIFAFHDKQSDDTTHSVEQTHRCNKYPILLGISGHSGQAASCRVTFLWIEVTRIHVFLGLRPRFSKRNGFKSNLLHSGTEVLIWMDFLGIHPSQRPGDLRKSPEGFTESVPGYIALTCGSILQ